MKKIDVDVLLVDGSYHRLSEARMAGIEVYYGEILSERAEETLEVQHLSHLLCATDNDFYNALVCKAQGRSFGHHRTFQLATHQESSHEAKRLTPEQRLGILGRDWLLLGGVTPKGLFRLYSGQQPFTPETGWALIHFAAERKREIRD